MEQVKILKNIKKYFSLNYQMANIKLNGIVIAENNLGDYDKMLTILTPNYGKISCVAKGARRPQSALLAGTQLF